MENQKEQLSLFTKEMFESRDGQQDEPRRAEANLGAQHFFVPWMGNDCVFYVGGGNCAAHGDFVDCLDCDDYKSVDDDDTQDNN